MRIGIIGCGSVSKAHIKALSLIDCVSSIALLDLNSQNMHTAGENAEKLIAYTSDVEELSKSSDGFIVCTPNNTHAGLIQAIYATKEMPFVCEKPLSSSLADAKRIVDLSNDRCIISFNYRFNEIFIKIKHTISRLHLGPVVFFHAEFNKNSAFIRKEATWRDSSSHEQSSGALGDLSCHLLDIFCWIVEEKIDINSVRTAKGTRVKEKIGGLVEVDDNGYVCGRSESGIFFTIKASKSDGEARLGMYFKIVLSRAELIYSAQDPDRIFLRMIDSRDSFFVSLDRAKTIPDDPSQITYWADSFHRMLSLWCASIAGKRTTTLPTVRDGYHIQEVLATI